MPVKDGFQVLSELKSHRINVKHIIATTPIINDAMIVDLQKYTIAYLLMKPFEVKQIINKINIEKLQERRIEDDIHQSTKYYFTQTMTI